AHTHGLVDRRNVAVGVGTDYAVAEGGEAEAADLVEVARGTAGDDAGGAERAIAGAHDFAERGADGRIVEVLEDDDGGAGEFGEAGHLLVEAAIDVAFA